MDARSRFRRYQQIRREEISILPAFTVSKKKKKEMNFKTLGDIGLSH
jgi:hypothetical protein